MVAVVMPLISAPGRTPQASGGRLVNTMIESLAKTAGAQFIYWRVPGMVQWGTSSATNFRGALLVGSTVYAVIGNTVFTYTSAGGAGVALTGSVPGTTFVFMAHNNAATPDIVIVAPGDGAFSVSGTSIISFADIDVGQPNSVHFHKGYFVFTYGDSTTRVTGLNNVSINALDMATAESNPDTLYRAIPLGNGQILLCGAASIEVWGGVNATGYPWSYIATVNRGIAGRYAITGWDDGFGKGIFFAGDDNIVYQFQGYQPTPVSPPDLDRLIETLVDKNTLRLSCYTSGEHAFVVVQTPTWCWEYNIDVGEWHERQSYLQTFWRGLPAIKAFGYWLGGDMLSGDLIRLDGTEQSEKGDPLRMRIETGPMGAFPQPMRINAIELYLTKGTGIATGVDPVQTNPSVEISVSRNGGQDWTAPRLEYPGRQSVTDTRVRSSVWGHAHNQGVRWRFDFSANVPFGFMTADMNVQPMQQPMKRSA